MEQKRLWKNFLILGLGFMCVMQISLAEAAKEKSSPRTTKEKGETCILGEK